MSRWLSALVPPTPGLPYWSCRGTPVALFEVKPRAHAIHTTPPPGAPHPRRVVRQPEGDRVAERSETTRRDHPHDATVHQLFARQAAERPDALAVAAPDQCLTYGELEVRANRLANRLRTLGVGPDVPVGLCIERSAALVTGALGILKAGGAYLAMDPSYPAERLAFMLRDAQVPVLVTSRSLAPRLDAGAATVIALDDLGAGLDAESPVAPPESAGLRDLAYVIYTSGSTGVPKGVMIEHESLLNLVFWHRRVFELTAADRATQVASPAFDAAVWELWPNLTAGASVHVVPAEIRADPHALVGWLLAERITVSFMPTPLAEAAMLADWPADTDLRLLLTGGDALHRHPPPGLPFTVVNNYGPTEGTVVATSGAVPQSRTGRPAPSIGRPIDNVRVHIVDCDMRLCSFGQAGELLLGGGLLARGYLRRPELTAERFVPDVFGGDQGARLYRTGDLVRYRPTGELEFVGRVDEQVQIRGFRVEPGEISATLDTHADVRSSQVETRADGAGQKLLVAYLVPANGRRPAADELRSHAARYLPEHMLPASYVWLTELPLTANGKVDRVALAALAPTTWHTDAVQGALPNTELESALAEMICELLALPAVGADENFFVLGGHSLLGAQLIARVRDRFGVEMALRSLFDSPTVAGMGAEIERLLLVELESMSDEAAAQLVDELATSA